MQGDDASVPYQQTLPLHLGQLRRHGAALHRKVVGKLPTVEGKDELCLALPPLRPLSAGAIGQNVGFVFAQK